MTLGETIHRLRTEKNLSQSELADALEVSRQSISKWETDSSVPELDKLIRLAAIFDVSMDQLILGRQPESVPQPEQPVPRDAGPEKKPDRSGFRTVGIILFCFAGLIILLLALLTGSLLGGLILSSPFLLCGLICVFCRRNAGLWCGWTLFFLVNLYLRYGTGITWRLVLMTPWFEPQMNYLRLIFGWIELLGFLLLLLVTVWRLGRRPLAPTRGRCVLTVLGWTALLLFDLLLNPILSTRMGGLYYLLGDWVHFALLNGLLVITVRLIRGRGNKTDDAS